MPPVRPSGPVLPARGGAAGAGAEPPFSVIRSHAIRPRYKVTLSFLPHEADELVALYERERARSDLASTVWYARKGLTISEWAKGALLARVRELAAALAASAAAKPAAGRRAGSRAGGGRRARKGGRR